ncbi:ATP-binding cassette domain-containing protein [Micromonospora viridifaciens]|nr:ABC transporter ATP-binding protein [Micromonospora viridifaciens]
MADEVIEAVALGKVYPDGTAALHSVGLTVTAGEIFGCLGRNGAGKSTMIRILTTLTAATSGQARVCGYDVAREVAAVRAVIGASLQQVALDDLMTSREHLDFVARLAGLRRAAARQRVDELLDLFGLDHGKLVATYSGGMRRRLDIALSLIRRPRVLFLDEPTTGLDPQSRRALWDWIRRFAAEGSTVLLTSQYLEEIDELADRVGVLDRGEMSVVDTPEGLKRTSGGRVLRVRVPDETARAAVREGLGTAAVPEGRDLLRLDLGGGAGLLPALARLRELGVPDTAITVSAPTLEDVFVRLTGEHLVGESADAAAAGVAAIQRSIATPGRGR